MLQAPSVVQKPEAPTVSFAPSQARQKDGHAARMSADPSSNESAAVAEAAGAASKQGSTVQEPQGLQVGLVASYCNGAILNSYEYAYFGLYFVVYCEKTWSSTM